MTEHTIKQAIAYCKRRIDILEPLNSEDEHYRGKYDRKLSIYNTILQSIEKQVPKEPKKVLRHRGGYETVHCPNCNTDYQADRRYKIEEKYCPECGKWIDSGFQNYCGNCGQALKD